MLKFEQKYKYLSYLFVAYLNFYSLCVHAQSNCLNPNRKFGLCKSIYQCNSLLSVQRKNNLTPLELQFLRESQCVNGYGYPPYVCCTTDKNYISRVVPTRQGKPLWPQRKKITPSNGMGNVLPEPPACGPDSLLGKIYNGNDTTLDEYPWMALLEYRDRNGKLVLNCGGSLINRRYILTAAHCVKGRVETDVGPLNRIRLGEYDINSEIDCKNDDCNYKVQEVDYEEIIPHPYYRAENKNRHHDIALIRLAKDVNLNDFVRPICLPLPSTKQTIYPGTILTVAGWGKTLLASLSNVKKKLYVPVIEQRSCLKKFRSVEVRIISLQLCAGGEFAKDSCAGDSGGPLMRQAYKDRWYLEGIISFGNSCGLEGWPGVYTRVADYVHWIQSTLRP